MVAATTMTQLRKDWDIIDEGPMEDLLGIECKTNIDGSITLHQNKYINSMINRFFTPEERSSLNPEESSQGWQLLLEG